MTAAAILTCYPLIFFFLRDASTVDQCACQPKHDCLNRYRRHKISPLRLECLQNDSSQNELVKQYARMLAPMRSASKRFASGSL